MIKVNNKKAIRNLANKSFKANKTRNIIAITAIALTAILFTVLYTMGLGTAESIQKASMRQAGGDGHAVLKYITDDGFNAVKNHPLVKEIAYDRILADNVENEKLIKRHTEFWYYDDVGLKLGFCEPTTGHRPIAENEIIADTKTLQLLGVPLKIETPVTLKLKIRGEIVSREFILCGWWDSDPGINVGRIFASHAYVTAHEDELYNSYKEDNSLAGTINAYIKFNNSVGIEHKLVKLITDSGFSLNKDDNNYIESNVNWAYLSTNFGFDPGTAIGLGFGLVLIIFTGYLIIYNIFQISIIRDIRFYGLLKTIGTTGKQIRQIIRLQAGFLSAIGIPIGLLIGFFIGKSLVPLLISNTGYAGSAVSVSPNPLIFIGSAVFALFTVFISTLKPGKIAAGISPIEAVRYTDNNSFSKTKKRNMNGNKMLNMAIAYMGRNKKRSIIVVISLSLSLILFNTVITLSNSIDMDKFISTFNDTDFLIAHADYFQNHFSGDENKLSETFIEVVQAQAGFEDGGRLYGGRDELFCITDKNNQQQFNKNEYGDYFGAVFGLDKLPFERMELLDGNMDSDKLMSGKYILEGVQMDDKGKALWESAHFKVGDTVILHNYKATSDSFAEREYTTQEYIILGHVAVKTYINGDHCTWDYTFYLPSDIYKKLVARPVVMSYAFNTADDKEVDFEAFLKAYTDTVEPTMNYTSKATTAASFMGMKNTVLLIGGMLGLIIGFIGILNFINTVLTSIITRRKEFAMLQSIGMTKKQLVRMLCLEGLGFAIMTVITTLVFGILCSEVIVRALCKQMWFTSYHFLIWPLLIATPVLIILGILVPRLAYLATDKQSIVERLREVE